MPNAGGFDVHREHITFGYVDSVTGQVQRASASADRRRLAPWLYEQFAGRDDVAFAAEA